jgi:sterol desaturase/sphingolipid hydroxylase (fatty acid hydroxylase superfamily)
VAVPQNYQSMFVRTLLLLVTLIATTTWFPTINAFSAVQVSTTNTILKKPYATRHQIIESLTGDKEKSRPYRVRGPKQRTALVFSTIPYNNEYTETNDSLASEWKNLRTTLNLKWKSIGEVTKWRIAAVSFLSAILMNRSFIDQELVRLWTLLVTSPTSMIARIFRTDSYEWCLAIAAFTVFIHWYQHLDRQIRIASERGIVHPFRKFRLQDRYTADKQRRRQQQHLSTSNTDSATAEPLAMVENDESIMEPTNIEVKQSKWHVGAYFFELWVYAVPLLTWDILSPRRHKRLAAFVAPTTVQIMTDVTGSLLFYDFLFFLGHYMMHHIPILYRKIHAKHHITDEVRACDIVRLSLVEEVYDVGCSIVALNLLSAHPISRSIYNVIIVFLLTELHSGYDLPWTPQNVIPFNIASGSRRHHYHHRFGTHYYQKFFFTFDRLFGLFQKDDGSLKGDSIRPDAYVPKSWKLA